MSRNRIHTSFFLNYLFKCFSYRSEQIVNSLCIVAGHQEALTDAKYFLIFKNFEMVSSRKYVGLYLDCSSKQNHFIFCQLVRTVHTPFNFIFKQVRFVDCFSPKPWTWTKMMAEQQLNCWISVFRGDGCVCMRFAFYGHEEVTNF